MYSSKQIPSVCWHWWNEL